MERSTAGASGRLNHILPMYSRHPRRWLVEVDLYADPQGIVCWYWSKRRDRPACPSRTGNDAEDDEPAIPGCIRRENSCFPFLRSCRHSEQQHRPGHDRPGEGHHRVEAAVWRFQMLGRGGRPDRPTNKYGRPRTAATTINSPTATRYDSNLRKPPSTGLIRLFTCRVCCSRRTLYVNAHSALLCHFDRIGGPV